MLRKEFGWQMKVCKQNKLDEVKRKRLNQKLKQ